MRPKSKQKKPTRWVGWSKLPLPLLLSELGLSLPTPENPTLSVPSVVCLGVFVAGEAAPPVSLVCGLEAAL